MKAQHWIAAIALVTLAAPAFAQQPSPAGRIKVVSGSAFIVRSGGTIRAEVGQSVFESDRLRTGEDGSIGITLDDDTRLSLGPSSEVRLDTFRYAPARGLGRARDEVPAGHCRVRVRSNCEARARFRPTRNAFRDCGRPRNYTSRPRRSRMTFARRVLVLVVIAAGLQAACGPAGRGLRSARQNPRSSSFQNLTAPSAAPPFPIPRAQSNSAQPVRRHASPPGSPPNPSST